MAEVMAASRIPFRYFTARLKQILKESSKL
uniref:Uncharacterized protein n=1 Tax=Amphimedon queenslandica TaxID=400682 RepID=A0A1X7ULB0_AMPQE